MSKNRFENLNFDLDIKSDSIWLPSENIIRIVHFFDNDF